MSPRYRYLLHLDAAPAGADRRIRYTTASPHNGTNSNCRAISVDCNTARAGRSVGKPDGFPAQLQLDLQRQAPPGKNRI